MEPVDIRHLEATRESLVAFAKGLPEVWLRLKIAALLLIVEEQRPGWTARVFGLMRMSLNRWIRAVNTEGLKALKSKPKLERPSRLTPQIAQEVERHLEQSRQDFGLNRARGEGPTLVEHLKRQYGLKLKVRQAQIWIHQLGYRLKRAGYTYLQARAEEARHFRRELKKTSKSGAAGDGGFSG